MNGLVRLSHVMGDVAGVNGNANISNLTPVYLRAIEEVSRQLWKETDTQFFAQTATRYYSGDNSRLFMLGDNLVSVTSLKISTTVYQPTTFDKTLVANTDYTLWPRNAANDSKPYRAILFNPKRGRPS
jgi:hypothetical protein